MTGREIDYSRNVVLLRAFKRLGTVDIANDTKPGSIITRSARIGLKLPGCLSKNHYDLIFVGFYGYFLMVPLGILSQQPILFDAFVSNYDTLCFDRKTFSPHSFIGRLCFWLDQKACNLARQTLVDTQHHAQYFADTFGLAAERLKVLPVGCNEDIFFPQPNKLHNNLTKVLFYCSYLPLHGVEVVVNAAALLSQEPIQFRLVGNGLTYQQVNTLASSLGLSNITFVPFMPQNELAREIAQATICLGGHFGNSAKANRVIPGKVYQILAMSQPLIAADTPANRELLEHGTTAYFCFPNDAQSLASAILRLHNDTHLRHYLAANGRILYIERCSETIITKQLEKIIAEITKQK